VALPAIFKKDGGLPEVIVRVRGHRKYRLRRGINESGFGWT
jgi:hypothetical protein